MARGSGPVHLSRVVRRYKDREYVSWLLRRSFREGGKVRHETVANVTALPDHAIDALRRALTGDNGGGSTPAAAGTAGVEAAGLEVMRSLPHGHIAAVWTAARVERVAELMGPPGRDRDLALALVLARACRPTVDPSNGWWAGTTLGCDLGLADNAVNDLDAVVAWLAAQQPSVEAALGRRHLARGGRAIYTVGGPADSPAPPTAGPSYGALRDPGGRPIAIDLVPGGEADPTAFVATAAGQRERFELAEVVVVGEPRLLSPGVVPVLEAAGSLSWITALRPAAMEALAAGGAIPGDAGSSLDPVELTAPGAAGERLVAWRDPAVAAARAADRAWRLETSERLLARLEATVATGRLTGANRIRARAERILDRMGTSRYFDLAASASAVKFARRSTAESNGNGSDNVVDGLFVLRTRAGDGLDAADVVDAYRSLTHPLPGPFDTTPSRGWVTPVLQGRAVLDLLAAQVTWRLRQAWSPILDRDRAPAYPARVAVLLDHLATLSRITIATGSGRDSVDRLSVPTATQQRAFELLGTPVALRLDPAAPQPPEN